MQGLFGTKKDETLFGIKKDETDELEEIQKREVAKDAKLHDSKI